MNLMRTMIALALSTLLAGCGGGKMLTSIPGGESKVFERPPYVVLGKTRYDQNWIDSQVEGGVAAFGWQRPAPRPPQLDAKPRQKVVAAPAKKRGLFHRIKDKILPAKKDAPVAGPVPAAQPPADEPIPEDPAPIPPPPPPVPAPRSDLDELLDPSVPLPTGHAR